MQSVNRFHLTTPHQADRVQFTNSHGRRNEEEGKIPAKHIVDGSIRPEMFCQVPSTEGVVKRKSPRARLTGFTSQLHYLLTSL